MNVVLMVKPSGWQHFTLCMDTNHLCFPVIKGEVGAIAIILHLEPKLYFFMGIQKKTDYDNKSHFVLQHQLTHHMQ